MDNPRGMWDQRWAGAAGYCRKTAMKNLSLIQRECRKGDNANHSFSSGSRDVVDSNNLGVI